MELLLRILQRSAVILPRLSLNQYSDVLRLTASKYCRFTDEPGTEKLFVEATRVQFDRFKEKFQTKELEKTCSQIQLMLRVVDSLEQLDWGDNEIFHFLSDKTDAVAGSWTHKSQLINYGERVKNSKTLVGRVAGLKVDLLYHQTILR